MLKHFVNYTLKQIELNILPGSCLSGEAVAKENILWRGLVTRTGLVSVVGTAVEGEKATSISYEGLGTSISPRGT